MELAVKRLLEPQQQHGYVKDGEGVERILSLLDTFLFPVIFDFQIVCILLLLNFTTFHPNFQCHILLFIQ